jgi:hypothetical protein
LLAVAKRCDPLLQTWIKSVVADVVADSLDHEDNGHLLPITHSAAPLKTTARVMDKKEDYRKDTVELLRASGPGGDGTHTQLAWLQRVGRLRDHALSMQQVFSTSPTEVIANVIAETRKGPEWIVRRVNLRGMWSERGSEHLPALGHVFEAGGMGDFARCSVSCDSPQQLRAMYEKLMAMRLSSGDMGEVVRVKNGFHPDAPSSGGYRDIKLNVLIEVPMTVISVLGKESHSHSVRHIAEVQLLLKHYVEVKAHMHLLYKVQRGDFF